MSSADSPLAQTTFGERYVVDIKKPLTEFDSEGGSAFAVKDTNRPNRSLYALVHMLGVPFRADVYKKLKSANISNLVKPVDRGIMKVDMRGGVQRMVTIFERPTGGALMDKNGKLHPKLNSAVLRQDVALSTLKALAGMHKKAIIHRSILPHKLYFAAPDSTDVWIGECCSAPTGYQIPTGLEPLELAFSDPSGRGEGGAASDYYQLGAAIMCLSFGEPLWKNKDRENLNMARVNQSSFWALSGGQDIPGALGNLVRGLMNDEVEERWTAQDMLDWFEGLGKPKRTGLRTWALNKPTKFEGIAYVDRRLLADALARNPVAAAKFIKGLDFSNWAHASLREEYITDTLEALIGVRTSGRGGMSTDRSADYRLVANFCSFLHPTGPIRYRGVSVCLDGIPTAIADAFMDDNKERLTDLSELTNLKFLSNIGDIIGKKDPDFTKRLNNLRSGLRFSGTKTLGKGLTRCLYELNPSLPCLSPAFENMWVATTKQLMVALDQADESITTKNVLTDRHVAAFMASKGEGMERQFNSLAAAQNDPARFAMLSTEFLASLQKSLKIPKLPNLTNRLVEGLSPALKSLKNKKRREKIQGLLDKVKKSGDISKLTSEVNLVRQAVEDAKEFSRARNQIVSLEREKIRLSKKILPTDIEPREKGFRYVRMFALMTLLGVGATTIL